MGNVVAGPVLPLAILLYWVANNAWTYAQQHLVHAVLESDERAIAPARP